MKLKKIFYLIICNLLICNLQYGQNITNTLGTSGLFTIKDASSNFLTLSQSTGQVNILKTLRLENTTNSTTGVIFKDTVRFLHNYGSNNTFVGTNSGNFTMTGNLNTALGEGSLYSNTSGFRNTALGYQSLYSNTSGQYNTSLGFLSLYPNTTGNYNTGVGALSLQANSTGYSNTALGYVSLLANTSGFQNTAVGNSSLHSNTTGYSNTAVGLNSLFSNSTGDSNTALGFSTGSNITTGGNLTLIGYNAQPTTGSATNQITLGNASVTSLRCNVQTISSLSDARDKKNIHDLPLGLDFVMKLKPREFNWDRREWYDDGVSDGSKMKEIPTAGFVAQELDEVQTKENAEWLNLVLKDNPEKLEATYGNLLPVMVKAIQELKKENDELKENNENLSAQVELLKSMNEKLVKLERKVNELASKKNTSLSEAK